jgi:uncharacterized protein YxeA
MIETLVIIGIICVVFIIFSVWYILKNINETPSTNFVICVKCQKNYIQVKKKHDFGVLCPKCEREKK